MLELSEISVRHREHLVLEDISLRLEPGSRWVITGPSGSGKSTLLKTILLFALPFRGQILWDGREVRPPDLAAYRARFLYIGQKPLPFSGTAAEYLNLPFSFAANADRKHDPDRQAELMQELGLSSRLLSSSFDNLSGGEQQRMSLIQGLQLDRAFCLFDEITSSLDPKNTQAVLDLLRKDTRITFLAVAHQREWMEAGFGILRVEGGRLRRDP